LSVLYQLMSSGSLVYTSIHVRFTSTLLSLPPLWGGCRFRKTTEYCDSEEIKYIHVCIPGNAFQVYPSFYPTCQLIPKRSSAHQLFYNIAGGIVHQIQHDFWRSDLLMLSVCTIGILSTLIYTEFDCVTL